MRSPILTTLLFVVAATAQQPAPPAHPEHPQPQPQGQVIFHRSEDQSREDPSNPTARRTPEKTIASITDAERSAPDFTSWNFDLHLTPQNSYLDARCLFSVRNSSSAPLNRLVFQISSSLHWDSITDRAALAQLPFTQHTVATDADHTGEASEIVITLPKPLAPNATTTLTALYSGTIPASAARLTRIGAPPEQAAHADWDQIAPRLIALRGFGNVLWYPVASPPLFLGDGARLFQAVGLSRLRQANAGFKVRLTIEYIGEPPVDAFLNGQRQPFAHTTEQPDVPVAESKGVAVAEFAATLGFRTPSLFITWQATRPSENQLLAVSTERPEGIAPYTAASNDVAPLLREWLGPAPLAPLTILDHTGQPFEDDAFLAIPLTATDASQITPAMVHSLAHAWFHSALPWLNEGVPQLMSLVYTESTDGREKSLAELRALINPLTLAEPENPADASSSRPTPAPKSSSGSPEYSSSSSSSTPPPPDDTAPPTPLPSTLPPGPAQTGQSLVAAHDEVYYRAKAAAVLFMLRSITGDAPLKRALQLYRDEVRHADPSAAHSRTGSDNPDDPRAFQRVLEATSHKDLSQLFEDWVYTDRGLADLSITNVTSRDIPARNGVGVSWLVAVEVHNAGFVAVDVPITVRSGNLTTTERARIPARSSVTTRILFEGVPQEIQVNDGTIPETTTPIHVQQLKLIPTLK